MQPLIARAPYNRTLQRLKDANQRVISGQRSGGVEEAGFTAVVLSCSECEPTRFFDLPPWELSVVQTPAQVLIDGAVASIAFSLLSDRADLVLVLGHSECGVLRYAFHDFTSGSATQRWFDRIDASRDIALDEEQAEIHAKRIARKLTFGLAGSFNTEGRALLVTSAIANSRTGVVRFHAPEAL